MTRNHLLSVLLSLAISLNLISCTGEPDRLNQRMYNYHIPSADRAVFGKSHQKREKFYPRWATSAKDKGEYDQVRNSWDEGLQRDGGFSTRDEFEKWRETLNDRP
jgi:hypothetical protein